MIRETTERNFNTSFLRSDQVADATQRVDLHRSVDFGEVLAQSMYVDLDRVRPDLLRQPVEIVGEQIFGDDPSAAPQQLLEHRDLARRKEDRLVDDEYLAGHGVERQVA